MLDIRAEQFDFGTDCGVGVQEFRSSGVQEFRSAGVLELNTDY
jgi:hypothetical protein